MKLISFFSGIFLVSVLFFTWGFLTVECKVFPWSIVSPIKDDAAAFLRGGGANKKTVFEKIANDACLKPERMLVEYERTDGRAYEALLVRGLKKRRHPPLVYVRDKNEIPEGYLFVWGCFDFQSHLFGALLLGRDGRVLHRWVPDENDMIEKVEACNGAMTDKDKRIAYVPPEVRFPHGMVVFPDGSIVFNDGDFGNGMQKMDFCSDTQWVKLGRFNHAITKKEGGKDGLWTIDSHDHFLKIDADTGDTLGVIRVCDIMKSNPETDLFSGRRNYIDGRWLEEQWHFNDLEFLPHAFAEAYPMFEEGDLLTSMRSLNTVLVLDPDSLQVKWWRTGAFSRQHDPDWGENGMITVYDNRMRDKHGECQKDGTARFSRIVGIDPSTYEIRILYEGEKEHFYSSIRGKHQMLPEGDILITSSMQGRVFIVNGKGETVFELVNRYDENECLLVSEAIWLPYDFFNEGLLANEQAE